MPRYFRLMLMVVATATCANFVEIGNVAAQNRAAFLLGNSDYKYDSNLQTPEKNVAGLKSKLIQLGFRVNDHTNLTKSNVRKSIKEFNDRLENDLEVAIFYYSGHAKLVKNEHFIQLTDSYLADPSNFVHETISLTEVLGNFACQAKWLILIFDASRLNPFPDGEITNIQPKKPSQVCSGKRTGSVFAFSTGAGKTAIDGDGEFSPFTKSLVKYLGTEGTTIEKSLQSIRGDLYAATEGKQISWMHMSGPIDDGLILKK